MDELVVNTSPNGARVQAHGDPDDHLRLAVLIAELAGDAAVCMNPEATWSARRDALEEMLRKRDRARSMLFIDPDALDVEAELENDPEDRWDDATFRRQRSELLAILLRDFARGGWNVQRPDPSARLTAKLDQAVAQAEDGSASQAVTRFESVETRVAPALRPIVRGLVRRGVMSEDEVAEALDTPSEVDKLVLVMSYDALPLEAREAACRLSVLRGPQRLNGVAGAFPIDAGDAGIRRVGLDALLSAGWLTYRAADRIEMARAVRHFLLTRASAADVVRDHATAAAAVAQTTEQKLEQHHHAVGARDIDRALDTALFYGADLRLLAIDLATRHPPKHREAAEVFRHITKRFDPKDAYAWEYLGYNLEEELHGKRPDDDVADEIRHAYAQACHYARSNPLYRGRELAFRVTCGERIAPTLIRYARSFAGPSFSDDALSYLAERPLKRLYSVGAQDQVYEIASAVGHLLWRHERLRPLLPR